MDNETPTTSRAQRVLDYVKINPWTNPTQVCAALGLSSTEAATALHDLTKSRRLIREKLQKEERPQKNVLYKYKARERYTKQARRTKRKALVNATSAVEHTRTTVAAASADVQIMLAVGKNETLVLSLAEARALAKQLQALV